jgi:alkylhydroperoxidase family enzyme
MTELTIHTTETAPDASRDALAALERNVGFIPNLAATLAGSPAALQGFVGMQSALRATRLSALEREVVGVTVSRENASPYSMAAHSTFAAGAGAEADVLAALRAGETLPDERLEALRGFVLAVLRGRGHLDGDALGDLVAAGYAPESALEVIAQIAYTTMANLAANVAATPVDAAFQPQSWSPESAVR